MNSLNLIGRLTADVEVKQTQSGVSVCQFCIAVKRPHTSDKTDFINCVAWRNTAEFIAKYFCKGKMIAVSGCLTSRDYEDKNSNKHHVHEVIVESAEFCGDKKQTQTAFESETGLTVVDDEEIPF